LYHPNDKHCFGVQDDDISPQSKNNNLFQAFVDMGDVKAAFALSTEPSVLELTAHSAPIDFKFFKGQSNIPSDYTGDGLAAFHGSWNRSKLVGYKVQRIRFQNGVAVGAEDFVTGFLKAAFPVFGRKAYIGRPTGLAITNKGIIYLSDDANGVIYAIKRKS
jgi:glucose/arabinose dehydrogenase